MAKGPYSRIVIRRPDGKTEIIGRPGLLDPRRAARELEPMGVVLAVRHEKAEGNGKPATIAIHNMPPTAAALKARAKAPV